MLIAGRRLSDNPRAAFRSISGLILALFIGYHLVVVAGLVICLSVIASTLPLLERIYRA